MSTARAAATPPAGAGRQFGEAIALIGNGPISAAAAATIDGYGMVIRINHARLCGAAGKRTDVLVLPNRGKIAASIVDGRPVNRRALLGAREIWFRNPEDPSNPRDSTQRLLKVIVRGRPHLFFPESNLPEAMAVVRSFAVEGEDAMPSAGAQTLWYLLRNFGDRAIVLFGFTHRGWDGHSWAAEQRWMESLIAAGRISRAETAGRVVKEPLLERLGAELVRFRRTLVRRIGPAAPGGRPAS